MLHCAYRPLASMLLIGCLLVLLCQDGLAGRIEAGTFTAHQTFNPNIGLERISFQQTSDTVPIVVALADSVGGNSASIRITNVTTTGFDELILETDNFDGGHLAQRVHYIWQRSAMERLKLRWEYSGLVQRRFHQQHRNKQRVKRGRGEETHTQQ